MQQKWFINILLLTVAIQTVQAEYFNPVTDKARHYVGLTVSGAEANNLTQNTVTMQPGYAAALDFRYEMDYHHFLIGIGAGAQYQSLNDCQAVFADEFSRADKEGEMYLYSYNYETYAQRASLINVELPLSLGYNFATYGYFLVGLKLTIPVKASYSTQTEMFTSGFYPWAEETFVSNRLTDLTSYSLFQREIYKQPTAAYKESARANIDFEIGGFLPIDRDDNNRLRIGAYADLGLRVGSSPLLPLVDYTEAEKVPFITTQEQLAECIHFNALLDSNKYTSLPKTLEVGIRLTWLIDVTISTEKCLLCEQMKKQRKDSRRIY